jgi:hypothetical protein
MLSQYLLIPQIAIIARDRRMRLVSHALVSFAALAIASSACGGCETESPPVGPNNGADASDGGIADAGVDDAEHDEDGSAGEDTGREDGGRDASTPDMMSCPSERICSDTCCEEGQECVDGMCLPPCSGTRCGDALDLCCTGEDVCIFDSCQTPGDDCTSSFQCPEDEYCEPTLGACLPKDAINTMCEFRPPIGMFTPSPENEFPGIDIGGQFYDGSITAPTVADVNRDGMPDIVVQLYRGALGGATLVVLDGSDMSVIASGGAEELRANAAGIAVGNIDTSTPELEIAALHADGGIVAFRLDNDQLVEMWTADEGALGDIDNEAAPSIADLDQDGTAEVILGLSVVDADGNIWNGINLGAAGGQVGNSGVTTAVDIDQATDGNGDMALELVAGNRVLQIDGTFLWDRSDDYNDGYPAVGDLDVDGSPEVVTVSDGEVFVFSADGQDVVFGPIAIPGGGQGGPPTIADFDGDGKREIAAAGQGRYTVFDPDCVPNPDAMLCPTGRDDGILWTVAVQDLSSSRTGSSVFDFEGDGKAEVVYNDECFLRVLDGTNGDILFERANTNRTGAEYPIVVDVDADFNAEIVVVSNNDQIDRDNCEENYANYPPGGTTGVFVYGDANDNWVPTRRIWNQHAYHITNILDDGEVPAAEPIHYDGEDTNSFRLNVQPDGLFNAPDLIVEAVEIRNPSCGEQVTVEVAVTVTNDGALGVGPGQTVEVTADNSGDVQAVGTVTTTRRLLPGQSETILIEWTLPAGWEMADFSVTGEVDPDGEVNECKEDNNTGTGDSAAGNRTFDDLVIAELTVEDGACGVGGDVMIGVTVENQGAQAVPAMLPVVLEAVRGASATPIDTVRTSDVLQGGTSESFDVTWTPPQSVVGTTFDVRATIDPNGEVTACSSDERTTAADCLPPQ